MTASPLAQTPNDMFNAPIAEADPEIAEMYREFVVTEAKRRHKRIAENGGDPGVRDVFA